MYLSILYEIIYKNISTILRLTLKLPAFYEIMKSNTLHKHSIRDFLKEHCTCIKIANSFIREILNIFTNMEMVISV